MSKVFLGGSRHVSTLAPAVRTRLDRIIEKGLPIVLGDANGADKAIQQYLHARRYRNVEVFCSGSVCRNNLGGWDTREVVPAVRSRGFAFFAAKDREMARQARFGLMVWDGRSSGTVLNVLRLLHQGKKVAVYNVSEKQFTDLSAYDQWDDFISRYDDEVRTAIDARMSPEDFIEDAGQLAMQASAP